MKMQKTNINKAGDVRELTLQKNGKVWVFKYEIGKEVEFFRSLVNMAEDPESNFDWFDAARLSHEMGSKLKARLKHED